MHSVSLLRAVSKTVMFLSPILHLSACLYLGTASLQIETITLSRFSLFHREVRKNKVRFMGPLGHVSSWCQRRRLGKCNRYFRVFVLNIGTGGSGCPLCRSACSHSSISSKKKHIPVVNEVFTDYTWSIAWTWVGTTRWGQRAVSVGVWQFWYFFVIQASSANCNDSCDTQYSVGV